MHHARGTRAAEQETDGGVRGRAPTRAISERAHVNARVMAYQARSQGWHGEPGMGFAFYGSAGPRGRMHCNALTALSCIEGERRSTSSSEKPHPVRRRVDVGGGGGEGERMVRTQREWRWAVGCDGACSSAAYCMSDGGDDSCGGGDRRMLRPPPMRCAQLLRPTLPRAQSLFMTLFSCGSSMP